MLIGEQSSERSADRNTVLHSPLQDMSFGAGTRMLWFRFSASQLWAPGRLRFRYRLIGIDEEWQITRNIREGRYTQLPPGRYTFEVEAGNSSGVWSAPTQLRFSIQPFFYQSTWFYLLCALLTFGIIALLFQFQLRRVSNRLRSRLSERLVERERIARELHDTLLQGFQGLILRFQGAVSRMTPDQPTRGQMESLLDEADRVLAESRDRVSELRQSPYESGELPEAIADVANKLAAGLEIDTSMKVVGDPRDIDIGVHAETFLIAREALSNAIRHSGAKRVLVTLEYERHALRLTIRDDGCGIDEAMLDAGGKPGHWGLQGMRERAQKLRATLLFRHPPEGGTEIELRIPANLAFSTAK
jgi:signal transduction histidine kinase